MSQPPNTGNGGFDNSYMDHYPDPNRQKGSNLGCILFATAFVLFFSLLVGAGFLYYAEEQGIDIGLVDPGSDGSGKEGPNQGGSTDDGGSKEVPDPLLSTDDPDIFTGDPGNTADSLMDDVMPDAVHGGTEETFPPLIHPGSTAKPETPDGSTPDAGTPGLDNAVTEGEVPERAELNALVNETMILLGQAIASKDFRLFHGHISTPFQESVTPAELKEAFIEFVDQDITLDNLDGLEPIYDEDPKINDSGLLYIYGHYLTDPMVQFELKYTIEGGKWLLYGVNVKQLANDADPEEELRVPSELELGAMAQRDILILNLAVNTEDFTILHHHISDFWKDQTTPEELKAAFQVFIDRKDLEMITITGHEAVIEESEIDDDGWLLYSGHFPSEPTQVNFELGYIKENGIWKLVKINVSM